MFPKCPEDWNGNCSFYAYCPCPELKPDPDIAGLGVICSFVISTACTILASMGYLFRIYHERRDAPQNRIDRWFWRSKAFNRRSPLPSIFPSNQVLKSVVMSLSDTQLVTGLAILITAFIQIERGTISAYHFALVNSLAMFGANSHIFSLIALRRYLRGDDQLPSTLGERQIRRNKTVNWPKYCRVVCMLSTLGLLCASCAILGHQYWYDNLNCPARCLMDDLYDNVGGEPKRWMIANLVLLPWVYCIALLHTSSRWVRWWGSFRERAVQNIPKNTIVLCLGFIWHFPSSMLVEILAQIAWFAYNIYVIVGARNDAQSLFQGSSESDWGFGQIVPLLLLMLPMLAALQAYYDQPAEVQCNDCKNYSCSTCFELQYSKRTPSSQSITARSSTINVQESQQDQKTESMSRMDRTGYALQVVKEGCCIECEDQPAEVQCNDCKNDFCSTCFELRHSKGTLSSQSITSLPERSPTMNAQESQQDEQMDEQIQEEKKPFLVAVKMT